MIEIMMYMNSHSNEVLAYLLVLSLIQVLGYYELQVNII